MIHQTFRQFFRAAFDDGRGQPQEPFPYQVAFAEHTELPAIVRARSVFTSSWAARSTSPGRATRIAT